MCFKLFVYYAVVAFNHSRKECKNDGTLMTAKKLADNIWLMYYTYDREKIKLMADEILNSLELV